MTGFYVINIGNASAKQWIQFSYENTLNGMSTGTIALDGVTKPYLDEFDVGSEINIYKDGVLKFKGKIIDQNILSGGGLILPFIGTEIELNDNKAPMENATDTKRVWNSTSDEIIFSTLITSVSGWNVDISNSSSITLDSHRITASMSVWDAVIKMITGTGKDIWVDQENKIVYLYNELTRSDQFVYIEGRNAKDISRKTSRSQAGKVLVYGKGDGDFQVVGSYGSGVPVHLKIDRNIISNDSADILAEALYNKLNPNPKKYNFSPTVPNDSLRVGDRGLLINNPNINDTVDITRKKISVDNDGTEKIRLEVTNPDFRIASKNTAEDVVKNRQNYNQSQSSMQGSGNTLNWDRGINAKNGASSKLVFYVPENFVYDDAGNIRINSMTVDYDIDPYKSNIGTATADFHAHSLSPGATDSHKHDVTNSSTHPHGIPSTTSDNSGTDALFDDEGSDTDTNFSASAGWNDDVLSEYFSLSGCTFLFCRVIIKADFSNGDFDVGIRIHVDGSYWVARYNMSASTGLSYYVIRETFLFPFFSSSSDTVYVDLYSSINQQYDCYLQVWGLTEFHSHGIGSFNSNGANANVTDSNKTPSLTGNSDTTSPSVTIGDDVSEAGSVNASEVDLFLDYWNGSTWDNKHSIINTGVTIDKDVDITDSGTFPDTHGWWRVRVEPDNASPDYVQSIVKIKHNLEN